MRTFFLNQLDKYKFFNEFMTNINQKIGIIGISSIFIIFFYVTLWLGGLVNIKYLIPIFRIY
jgi:hypothetical protein